MMKKLTFVLALICLYASTPLHGQTLFAPETFGDGGVPSVNGWSIGNSGSVDADAGDNGVGDHAINYGTTSGFHFFHPRNATPNVDFLGDYVASGVTAIRFRARHSGVGDALALRATLFLPLDDFDWAQSSEALVITPSDTTWQTYELSLLPGDLQTGGNNGVAAADLLTNVAQVGLRHDPSGAGPSNAAAVSTLTRVYFDDVMLVPEPTTLGLSMSGFIAILLCRRRSVRYRQ